MAKLTRKPSKRQMGPGEIELTPPVTIPTKPGRRVGQWGSPGIPRKVGAPVTPFGRGKVKPAIPIQQPRPEGRGTAIRKKK